MKLNVKLIYLALMFGVIAQPSQAQQDLALFSYGDSITAGLIEANSTTASCADGVALGPDLAGSGRLLCFGNGAEGVGGYQPELKESLQDIGYDVLIYNYGYSGANTAFMVNNLFADLSERPNSEYVLLMGGANDAGEGVSRSTIKSNLQLMVDIVCSQQMIPVLATVTRNVGNNTRVVALNRRIREIVSGTGSRSGCGVIQAEVYEAAEDQLNFNADGLHLSAQGNTSVANEWFRVLNLPEIVINKLLITPVYELLLND